MAKKLIAKFHLFLWLRALSWIENHFVDSDAPGASWLVDLCLALKEGLTDAG